MEDYKKKYEEALERCKKEFNFNNLACSHEEIKQKLERVFPELKESEDERIKREILELVSISGNGNQFEEIKDWLEKQGEHKEINLVEILKHYPRETELYSPLYGKLWLAEVDEEHEIITCYKYQLENGCTRAKLEQEDIVAFYSNGTTGLPDFNVSKDCMLFLYNNEKQVEQKHTDKVKPKFKAGDYIINGHGFIMQIDGIDGDMYCYHVLDNNRLLKHDITKTKESCHLWTISDAKDGDVLATKLSPEGDWIGIYKESVDILGFKTYCFLSGIGEFVINPNRCKNHGTHGLHPATKEQRDLLFQKMKEVGYEWDTEKKELKKIEKKPIWSEEDERICKCLIKDQGQALNVVKNDKFGHSEIISDLKEMYRERIDWLKSLKERMKGE